MDHTNVARKGDRTMNAEMRVEMAKIALALHNVGRGIEDPMTTGRVSVQWGGWLRAVEGYCDLRAALGLLPRSYIVEDELRIVQDSGDVIG
jgi:hypothetical protein